MLWGPLAGRNKAPVSVCWGGVGKGTVEALIREVIKGQGVFFRCWGMFYSCCSVSDKSADVKCRHWCFNTQLAVGELNSCAASWEMPVPWEALHVGRLTDPKCLGRGAVAHLPSLLQYVDFLPRCVPRSLQKGWKWKTAGMGTWSLCGVEGLEVPKNFSPKASQGTGMCP